MHHDSNENNHKRYIICVWQCNHFGPALFKRPHLGTFRRNNYSALPPSLAHALRPPRPPATRTARFCGCRVDENKPYRTARYIIRGIVPSLLIFFRGGGVVSIRPVVGRKPNPARKIVARPGSDVFGGNRIIVFFARNAV